MGTRRRFGPDELRGVGVSRDPTVTVDLTATTPVGPVARPIEATQATDRVERLRYWRRGGGGSSPVPLLINNVVVLINDIGILINAETYSP